MEGESVSKSLRPKQGRGEKRRGDKSRERKRRTSWFCFLLQCCLLPRGEGKTEKYKCRSSASWACTSPRISIISQFKQWKN
jgi:hypothetical protein